MQVNYTKLAVLSVSSSVWFFLTPPLGLLAGAWLLNEPLNWIDFIGIVPVVLGIVLVTRAR